MEKLLEDPVEQNNRNIPIEMRYQAQKELLLGSLTRQFEYGKWVLASLLAVNGGSLIAIAQSDKKAELFKACGELLIFGLTAAVLAGGLAWINFSVAALQNFNALLALSAGNPYTPSFKAKLLANGTYIIAPIVAAISMSLFVVAAFKVAFAL